MNDELVHAADEALKQAARDLVDVIDAGSALPNHAILIVRARLRIAAERFGRVEREAKQ
jgi:hypothetical protein